MLEAIAFYVAGVLSPFAYLWVEDWWFRRRMRKAGIRVR